MALRSPGVMLAPAPWNVSPLWNRAPPAGTGQGTGLT